MFAAQLEGVDVDAPRAKRQKTTAGNTVTAKEEPAATNGLNGGDVRQHRTNTTPSVFGNQSTLEDHNPSAMHQAGNWGWYDASEAIQATKNLLVIASRKPP